ncbi:MAG TPA: MgtC/SapB family protein [Sphingobacterium sp.]|nr:MgtC/SapB family protein [Sphingobacterium sp.]
MEELLLDERFQAILVSIGCGAVIGLEREYKNKSAGFRTVILICFGATIFAMISRMGAHSDDRVAANIVTGIGFIGAGVIYHGKFSVQGLTTAAVIWSMAAIGMMIGFGEFKMGIATTVLMVIILSLFQNMEDLLAKIYLTRTIQVTFMDNSVARLYEFEQFLLDQKVRLVRKGMQKDENHLVVIYDVSSSKKRLRVMNEQIISLNYVYSFSNLA